MHAHTLILGAGSAGAVLAARLTEQSDCDVLLVDAGPDYAPAALPADLANGRQNAMVSHDWGYQHRPCERGLRFPLPRGRVVGGSSAVNTCIAIRPLPRDIDEWAALGLTGWSWDDCLPALKRLETDYDFDDPWHGRSGPLPLRRHPAAELHPWQAALVDAALRTGHPACADTNNPNTPAGAGPHAMNKLDGRRISAAEAWLRPEVRARPNLTILPKTTVDQLTFDGSRVTGASVRIRGGAPTALTADRVLVACGAINTPKLLLRSGIGPEAELSRLGVAVRAHLPGVGARLLDHPGFAMFFRPRRPGVRVAQGHLIQTVVRCSSGLGPWDHDLQLQAGTFVPLARGGLPGVSIMGTLGKLHGHGTLTWNSLDDRAKPVVESRFFSHPEDHERAAICMEVARELAATPDMARLASHFWPSGRRLSTRAGIKSWVPRATNSGYHPCGTVPMGPSDDPLAVCDSQGRVRGFDGLHVVDASLMPTIPTGNIHLTVLMVAEHLATMLREPTAVSGSAEA